MYHTKIDPFILENKLVRMTNLSSLNFDMVDNFNYKTIGNL